MQDIVLKFEGYDKYDVQFLCLDLKKVSVRVCFVCETFEFNTFIYLIIKGNFSIILYKHRDMYVVVF